MAAKVRKERRARGRGKAREGGEMAFQVKRKTNWGKELQQIRQTLSSLI